MITERRLKRFCEDYERILEAAVKIAEIEHPNVPSSDWRIDDVDLGYVSLSADYREACGCCWDSASTAIKCKYLSDDGVALFEAERATADEERKQAEAKEKLRRIAEEEVEEEKRERAEYDRLKGKYDGPDDTPSKRVCL